MARQTRRAPVYVTVTAYKVGDVVTWLGGPGGRGAAYEATVIAVGKMVRVRFARPDMFTGEVKLVHPDSLRAGAPEAEVRWSSYLKKGERP